ncbi:MAG: phosphoribosylanthranilate isomerase [Leadbetterella sp.]|nr:phosphoribosylanthranilate isomerase [Leadbetterella sp.]
MKIKVCGMREAGNIREVAALGPDFMGFIFYPRSPRYVGEDFVLPEVAEGIRKTGVFVNAPVEHVLRLARQYGLDYVQLHGDETQEYGAVLKDAGLKILKAFAVDASFELESLKAFEEVADYFLLDTKGDGYGGQGRPFDWNILKDYKAKTPFLVAGGISNDNIQELLKLDHPLFYGIDVNSRYEISPGLKDVGQLREAFLRVSSR